MRTGIELIAQERAEQILKHSYNARHDSNNHQKGELLYVALFCITGFSIFIPRRWDRQKLYKLKAKSKIHRLVAAGALIAAEIDRISNQPSQ